MYLGENVYQKYVTYYDLPDMELFHQLLTIAKDTYYNNQEYFEELSNDEIAELKKNKTPVLFASTVTSYKNDDYKLLRPDMNDRAKRRYLIIDADFAAGQDNESNKLWADIESVATKHKTPLVIYPTASYPDKPRFRAVMFAEKLMNESQYYQAMSWWYNELGILDFDGIRDPLVMEALSSEEQITLEALDLSNKRIRSNNNAPFFINEDQIENIVDTTQDESLKPLDNKLWANEPKPDLPKKVTYGKKSEYDTIKFTDKVLKEGCHRLAQTEFAKNYETFWRFLHSVARAEINGQLTTDQVLKVLDWIAECGNEEKEVSWKLNNHNQYKSEYTRVATRDNYLKSAKPLAKYKEFADLISEHMEGNLVITK